MALDKLLSESIDTQFFEGKCPLEKEETRSDGKTVVKRKGTIALLEEWILAEITWDDPGAFREVVVKPLRTVRRLRQTPAHAFTADKYSADYHKERRKILWEVFNSLSNIRANFARHPLAENVEVADWLDDEPIDVF